MGDLLYPYDDPHYDDGEGNTPESMERTWKRLGEELAAPPPSTWLPTNDTHAPAPEPSAHVEPVDDVAFVDPYCQHEDGTEAGCLEPAVRVVGAEYLCQGHATLADLQHAGVGRTVPDPLGEAIAAATPDLDERALACLAEVERRLFGGGL